MTLGKSSISCSGTLTSKVERDLVRPTNKSEWVPRLLAWAGQTELSRQRKPGNKEGSISIISNTHTYTHIFHFIPKAFN